MYVASRSHISMMLLKFQPMIDEEALFTRFNDRVAVFGVNQLLISKKLDNKNKCEVHLKVQLNCFHLEPCVTQTSSKSVNI